MKTLGVFLGILGVALLGLAAWMGLFLTVSISEEEQGPYTFVYRPMETVDFQQIGQATDEIGLMLEGIGIADRDPMQIYFPDGSAQVGFAVEADIRGLQLSDGTTMRTIPAQTMLTTRFPWRNPASFVTGQWKVAPAFSTYRTRNGLSETESMTVYLGAEILYLQPRRE